MAGLVAVGNDAAVAVRSVFAQAQVGDDDKVGPVLFNHAGGALHDAVPGVGAGAQRILFGGNAEEQHGAQAELHGFADFLFEFGKGKLELAGHGVDGLTEMFVGGVHHEVGHDEIGGGKGGFAHHVAKSGSAAQTAAAMEGKFGHDNILCAGRARQRSNENDKEDNTGPGL